MNLTNFPNAPQCNAHERFAGTGKLRYWYSYGINQSLYDTAGYDLAANYTFTDLGPVPGILNVKGIWTRRDNHEFQTTFSFFAFSICWKRRIQRRQE